MLAKTPMIKVPHVVAKVMQDSAAKLSANAVSAMTRWAMEHGNGQYVDELIQFHADAVNPTELSASPSWFEVA